MNRTTTVRRVLVTGAAAFATLAIAAACGGTSGMDHDGTGPMMTSAPPSGAAVSDADVAFAQMMILHHQQAVEMAVLAETRASDPELKQIAAKIKSAQEPEIATMTGWLTGWGSPTGSAGHNMPGMNGLEGMPGAMSVEEMAQLKAAKGVDFDRMFARMMIAHHNGAIQMCRDVMGEGADPRVKALATTMEQAQSAEVATLQTILDRL